MIIFSLILTKILIHFKDNQYALQEKKGECELASCSENTILNLSSTIEYECKSYTLRSVGERCCQNKNVKLVILPNSIQIIKYRAFFQCKMLEKIFFCDSLEKICSEAFSHCKSLKEIRFNSKKRLDFEHCAFGYCNGMLLMEFSANVQFIRDPFFNVFNVKTVIFHNDFNSEANVIKLHIPAVEKYLINNGKFYKTLDDVLYDSNFERLIKYPPSKNQSVFHIPSTVVSINQFAFSEAIILSSINISESVANLTQSAFIHSSIFEITIPATCINIGCSLFLNCLKLRKATIKSKIDVLPDKIFDGCVSLEYVQLPNLREIGNGCFTFCHSIKLFNFPTTVRKIGMSSFYGCRNLHCINFSNVQEIHENAFFKCTSLLHIELPKSVSLIEKRAFAQTGLTSVRILGNVTINYEAFCNCNQLSIFNYEGNLFNDDQGQLDGTNVKAITVTYDYKNNSFAGKPVKGNYILYL